MPRSGWTSSIVPSSGDQNVYLVLDCFDRLGCAWRKSDVESTDLETVISDLMSGQYNDPQRVVAFNTSEQWAEDVSETSRARSDDERTTRTRTSLPRSRTSSCGTPAVSGSSI